MRVGLPRAITLLLFLSSWGCSEVGSRPTPTQQQEEAAMVPPLFTDTKLVDGLDKPTSMAFAPDGRLFICEQAGRLRILQDGRLLPEPFLSVETDSSGERGLLGVAFDPDFPLQPYVYVYYTATRPTVHNRLSRFTASGNRAEPGSERILLELEPLEASIHNGGALHFGADGKLYLAVGDNARATSAQSLGTLRGKLLRLNKDGSIPTDNPFFTRTTGNNRAIWALGLRNPFSFAVQPGTGRLFINDVGQGRWEEINESAAGANHGWPDTEGPTSNPLFRAPLFAYPHGSSSSQGCAITGGTFYNPPRSQFPAEYTGRYFFSDYCNGWIRTLEPATGSSTLFATELDAPVDLDVGPDGSLYYLDRGDDSVHRIRYTAASEAPTLVRAPESQTVSPGQRVSFTASATGTPPLRYQWLRNGTELPGQTAASLTLPAVARADSNARFRVRVSNDSGSVLSPEAVLLVRADTAPVATIVSPTEGALYSAGDVITFEGLGTDAEDGALPASAFTWRVDFHHDDHLHPFVPATSGVRRGTFTVPVRGETSANVWYRVHLRVRDSAGATHEVFRDVLPRKVRLLLDTEPAGLRVALDGQPGTTPLEVRSVVGVVRTLEALSPQVKDGTTYVFERWADGATGPREFPTPSKDTRYRAVFRAVVDPSPAYGLRAEYFDTAHLTGVKRERVDPTVDFRWKTGSPDPALDGNTFSVRWTGSVVPRHSGTYTFYTQSNDGVRLWVDGRLLIDHWTRHETTEDSATLALEAGRAYSLRMEFFEHSGLATARLFWSSPTLRKQIIPKEQLRPTPP
jgi:glucose/arabinose dehydrogenase